jgi:hypothetical protein
VETEVINPFYLEAVATYGVPIRTCDHLQYMQAAGKQLDDFLVSYEKETTRYGGTVPLRGSHGSGKTHLLSWLGLARSRPRSQPTVLYAKVDRASFFDLFSQLISQLPQVQLQHLIAEAIQQLALEKVGKAKITTDLGARLQSPASVVDLAKEGNIDRDELFRTLSDRLQKQMQDNKVPLEIPTALLKVDSPTLGERAYQWMQGKKVEGLEELGLAHYLGELAQDAQGSSVPELAAIDALETIAALHQFAGRPLVILVDQLEVFVRGVEIERKQMLSSLIKKLLEQLGRQNAMTFIAGAEDAWDTLPRDVTPRLRVREPLKVGSLNLDETRIFLESFTKDTARFSQESVTTIHQLAGGNPREIIRIAYQAFKKLDGRLNEASHEDLLAGARESGTVADRERIALATVDKVFAGLGTISQDLDLGGKATLERLLLVGTKPRLALVTVKATDQLSEVQSARRVPAVVQYLEQTWPKVPLIVTTIGYSSSPVAELLGRAGAVLEFSEETFASQLRTRVVELLTKQEQADRESQAQQHPTTDKAVMDALKALSSRLEKRESAIQTDPAIADTLRRISQRLDEIEIKRKDNVERVAQNFSNETLLYAKPDIERRELQSKWDVLDELERLLESRYYDSNRWEEGQVIRRILVTNEAVLKIKYLDDLGGAYLDLLTEERLGRRETVHERRDLIFEMQRVLRNRSLLDRLIDMRWKFSGLVGVAVAMIYQALQISFLRVPIGNIRWFPIAFVTFAVAVIMCIGCLFALTVFKSRRDRRLRRYTQRSETTSNYSSKA